MAYIYVKQIGSKKYYYLRVDKRVNGKKIVKDIAYLGSDLSKVDVKKLISSSKYGKEITKSYKQINHLITSNYYYRKAELLKYKKNTYLTKEQLIRLNAISFHFSSNFKKLHQLTAADFLNNFVISYTYNTTSIEGNTIALADVKKILTDDSIYLKNKTLREIYDLRNTKDTFNYIFKNTLKLSLKVIIDIHKKLMKDVDDRVGFRNFDVRVFKSHFKSSLYFRIDKEINDLLSWFNISKENIFVRAVIFHHKFEKIHPFGDGNGRTGRMLLNLILLNNNLPPLIITKKNKKFYFDSLSIADKKEDYSFLISFLLDEYEKGYWQHFIS
jgi:Fic family protein